MMITKMLILSSLLISGVLAQSNQINLFATPPDPVQSFGAQVVGRGGSANYYYWIVANYPIGKVMTNFPALVINAPDVLGVGNAVRVFWNPVNGATSYDVLRTITPNIPSSGCGAGCARVLGTTSTTFLDTGGPPGPPYTISGIAPARANIILDNKGFAQPRLLIDKPVDNLSLYTLTFGDGSTQTSAGISTNPLFDAMIGYSPGGSAFMTGFRAPAALASSWFYDFPSTAPSAKSVIAWGAPAARAGNDPSLTNLTAPATVMPVNGAGANIPTMDASPADGCVNVTAGKLGTTGAPCAAGGGGQTLPTGVMRPFTGPPMINPAGPGPGANALATHWFRILNTYATQSFDSLAWFTWTAEPGSLITWAIYDTTCTLVAQSPSIAINTASTTHSVTFASTVNINTPYFYLVYSGECTNCAVAHYLDNSTAFDGTGSLLTVGPNDTSFDGPVATQPGGAGTNIIMPANPACGTKTPTTNTHRLPPAVTVW